MEQLANNPLTTLNGAINDSVTSLTVASAALFPTTGTFTILIGSELLLVTSVSGTTFTVTRGSESTTAASHSNGASVTGILTKRSLEQFRQDLIPTGTFSSRPTTTPTGSLFLPTDSYYLQRYTGSGWTSFGPLFPMTPFVLSDYTWVNQFHSTVSSANGSTILTHEGADGNGEYASMLVKSAPATPYAIDCLFLPTVKYGEYYTAGFVWRESSTGNYTTLNFGWNNSSDTVDIAYNRFNSSYVYGGSYFAQPERRFLMSGFKFFRAVDNGTDRQFYISCDGVHWLQLFSHSRTTYLTANQVGILVQTPSDTPVILNVLSWKEGVP